MSYRDKKSEINYPLLSSTGVLRPPHPKQLGGAYLLLMKLEDMVTTAEGTDGLVLRGAPVSDSRISREMGLPRSTVISWRRRLLKHGYIDARRTDRGFILSVHKSKKAQRLGRERPQRCAVGIHTGALSECVQRPSESAQPIRKTNAVDIRQKAAAFPAQEQAWKAIGLERSVGPLAFRRLWESTYTNRNGGTLSVAMGTCLDAWQTTGGKAPAQFAQAIGRIRKLERDQATTHVSDPLAGILAKPEDIPTWQTNR